MGTLRHWRVRPSPSRTRNLQRTPGAH
ncbi:MAG: hypothetical protein EBQ56_06290 [Proteobacteria bacterium]|nr:hypothetical protein [Pseudomonadota bacterium]NBX46517.1 hypothetical protein [Chloroflexota bacterium]NBQ32316.1 hypothetical protein [Pseudomonadota bacterium]NBT02715.1 hypothetical protein [Pseudomonadota bacterium]NBT19916.1 hypothetical protein [Pseudomonadota bacterium]